MSCQAHSNDLGSNCGRLALCNPGTKTKRIKLPTIAQFCADNPQHKLIALKPGKEGKIRPVWCGVCEYTVEGNEGGYDSCKRLKQHVDKTRAHMTIDLNIDGLCIVPVDVAANIACEAGALYPHRK